MTNGDVIFRNKYALVDTNILSEMAKSKGAERFRSVFDFLKANNIEPFLLDVTRFEFVGSSKNRTDYEFFNNWIRQFRIIFTQKSDINLAIFLSSIYKCCNPNTNKNQISFCDCLHAAQMVKFQEQVFVVSTDIHDYPYFLFDIKKDIIVDENGKAVFVAFFMFNRDKWKSACRRFLKSKRKDGT